MIYSSPKARIKINGSLSNRIILQHGCRQGFSIKKFIEPLAQCVREENQLEGVITENVESKKRLYADDVLVTLGNPEELIPLLMEILEEYGSLQKNSHLDVLLQPLKTIDS